MARGRKPKPRALKLVDGTNRADRENPDAPEPARAVPKAPEWLTDVGRECFAFLVETLDELYLASESHVEMAALAATRMAEVRELTATIEKEGRTYVTTNSQGGEMIRPNPAVAQRNEAMRHLQSLLAEFGLSPASNGKVSVGVKPKGKNKAERYFGT